MSYVWNTGGAPLVGGGGGASLVVNWTPPSPAGSITGYYVLYDTVSRQGTGVDYASSGTTYYYTVVSYDGTNQSPPEYEQSAVA
jgi:hypothetical protein